MYEKEPTIRVTLIHPLSQYQTVLDAVPRSTKVKSIIERISSIPPFINSIYPMQLVHCGKILKEATEIGSIYECPMSSITLLISTQQLSVLPPRNRLLPEIEIIQGGPPNVPMPPQNGAHARKLPLMRGIMIGIIVFIMAIGIIYGIISPTKQKVSHFSPFLVALSLILGNLFLIRLIGRLHFGRQLKWTTFREMGRTLLRILSPNFNGRL